MELQHPLLNIGLTAIPGDSPCGINAKYEPSFEALEAELAKQESLSAETVDWKEVKALATDLLQNTTKDFLVACYLTHSLTITEGFEGLLVGFKILESFTTNYWQESFPPAKRLRARKTAIEWLVEKTNQHLESTPPTNNDNAIIVELAKTIKNLDYDLAEKMDAQAPNMSELNRSFKRLKQAAEFEIKANEEKAAKAAAPSETEQASPAQEAPIQAAASEPAATAPDAASAIEPAAAPTNTAPANTASVAPATNSTASSSAKPVTISTGNLASEADAKKLYKQVQEGLRQLAEFHSANKASDPKRYRYSRSALWDSLDKIPPHKDGKTQLPKPPVDKLKKLQELFEQGEFIAVLEQAEKSASKMPYWFDGQRIIANSLEALGGEYSKANEALIGELKSFIKRIPSIIDLCYSDGTPFADEQTLLWLNTQVLAEQEAAGESKDAISECQQEAQKLAASGKLSEGLDLLKTLSTQNLRDDFRVKLASAELVAQSGQTKVAIPLLERLINETKRINAIDWETDFTIKAYRILVQAYEKLEDEDAVQKQQQKADAFDQLCWFDPTAVAE